MLNLLTSAKIFVYGSMTDMRKGVDGLSGIVRGEFAADPTDGSLFVFINRRRDRLKILFFDGGGYWLYYRILEAGTFEELRNPQQRNYLTIDFAELSMLLSGISLVGSSRRRKRFTRKERGEAA
jgi:transposase